MTWPRNILLVGFMGSGKSRVGKALSLCTGWSLEDADTEIEARAGKSIPRIFQEDGEPAFRSMERSVLRDLCSRSGRIIAAGGGAFVDPENQRRMLASGLVFCLIARPETIHRRISEPAPMAQNQGDNEGVSACQPDRPLLAGADPMARIKELLEQRAEAYAMAHYSVQTDDLTPEQVAQRILELCGPKPAEG